MFDVFQNIVEGITLPDTKVLLAMKGLVSKASGLVKQKLGQGFDAVFEHFWNIAPDITGLRCVTHLLTSLSQVGLDDFRILPD